MKKYRIFSLILVLSLIFSLPVAAEPAEDDFLTPPEELREYNYPTDFTIDAAAYALIELKSNSIIYSKELDMKRYPASLTKLMTCMLAIEYGNPEDVLTVSKTALENLSEFGSTAGLVEGEQMKLDDMLYCIMLWSANEGCNVIAEHISGSVDAFVEKMNATAQALGMTNTHFANTHGLHSENHYTTVRDLTVLARWAWQNETFRRYATATVYTVPATNKSPERVLHTTNYLTATDVDSRYYYSLASGIKTGFTTPAGGCLISTATDGDAEYMSIVVGCDLISTAEDMRFIETKKLFQNAFANYSFVQVLSDTVMLDQPTVKNAAGRGEVVVHAAENATVLLPQGAKPEDISIRLDYSGDLTAPIEAGQRVGTATAVYQGVELASCDLLALTKVEAVQMQSEDKQTNSTTTPQKTEEQEDSSWSWLIVIPLVGLGIAAVAFAVMRMINVRKARRRAEMRRRRQERRRFYDE